jgi:hypothetical protein
MRHRHGMTPILIVVAAVAVGCSSTGGGARKPAGDPMRVLVEKLIQNERAYKTAKIVQPSEEECAAMTREGEALLAAGKRDEAIAAYDRTRRRCVDHLPVRRQLFLARHPDRSKPAGTAGAGVVLNLRQEVPGGPRLHFLRMTGYLDGIPLTRYKDEPFALGDVHELMVEIWYTDESAPDSITRTTMIEVRGQVIVDPAVRDRRPLLGAALVAVEDSGDEDQTLDRRLTASFKLFPFKPREEVERDPDALADRGEGQKAVMLAPNKGTALRVSDVAYRIPPALQGKRFWTLQKVCVRPSGAVERVKTIKHSGLPSDQPIHDWVMTWRYRPHFVDGRATPFCYPLRMEIR